MSEALKTVLLTVACYGAAMLLAGSFVWGIAWLIREERPEWVRISTVLALIGFFVVYPLILLVSSWMNTDSYQPYDDRPYENKYDRFS